MTQRWTQRKKENVVTQVINGTFSFTEACDIFDLSFEELGEWIIRKNHDFTLKATRRFNPFNKKVNNGGKSSFNA